MIGGMPSQMPGAGGGFRSQTGTVGNWQTNYPDDFDWSGNEDGFYPVTRLRQQYVDYLATKVLEYEEQKVSRHYYHGSHWTPEEIRVLRARRQPIITYNRISRKVDSIVGLVQRMRQQPKAYPRNPKNAPGAEIATNCIRAALDGMDFENLDFIATRQAAIEGIGGIELKLVQGDHADPDISGDFIFGDDFFYDPRSYKPDFSDARYMGIAKWLDVEAAVELFPDRETDLRTLMVDTGFDLTTHADREFKWVYVNEQRLRLIEHWYKNHGKWYWAFYCSMILLDQGVSPFLDERNRPMNRYVMFSSNVDHDGDRYGFARNLKGPQDELNQRRSKALHISNTTKLILQKGAVDDVETTRREYARPDGVIEYNQGFEAPTPADKESDLKAHLSLMQDARSEIDSYANIVPDVPGVDDPNAHSGVAINYLQKAGISEISAFVKAYANWKLRVYRAVWNIISRTWQAERWIRVTNSQGLQQFIQVNGLGLDQYGQPQILNAIGSMDIDLILDEGPDVMNSMLEAWEVLKQQPPGTIPPAVLMKVAPLQESVKNEIIAMLQPPPDPIAQQHKELSLHKASADVAEKKAAATQRLASAAKSASEAHINAHQMLLDALNLAPLPDVKHPTPQPQGPTP